jgi:enoyl-CoA hydratase
MAYRRAAGVDLSELVQISTSEAHCRRFLSDLTDAFAAFKKPIIAAVVGFAVCPFAFRTVWLRLT